MTKLPNQYSKPAAGIEAINNFKTVALVCMLIIISFTFGCVTNKNSPNPSSYNGKTLRQIISDNYTNGNLLVGATTGSWAFGLDQGAVLDREFSYVTPENDYKHAAIRSASNTWNWSSADAWITHIVDHNQILRMHCPIGPQCATWIKEDTRTSNELENELKIFIQEICERYNGKTGYRYMDVVNETIQNGVWLTNMAGTNIWENPWFIIGQDTDSNSTPLYIKMAFETAKTYGTNIKFIYNHHEGPEMTASWLLIKSTVLYLISNGLRVDGVGWQAHVDKGWETTDNINALKTLISNVHAAGLEFYITEASVWLKSGNSIPELNAQADTYRAIIKTLIEMRSGGVVAWNTWHVSDAYGWHTEWYPSLFDNLFQPKPAYTAIQDELSKYND